MNKRKLHHWLVVIKRVKTWQLLLALIVFGSLSAVLLRQNSLHMSELRNVVRSADEQNADIKKSLLDLQHYVSHHMNTGLGDGILLQYSYQRAYNVAVEQAVSTTNPNTKLYEQVELECRPVFQRTGSFPAYTQCAREKLGTLAPGQDALSALKTPPVELFRYNFASPVWSADAAGFAVLATLLTGMTLLLRLLSYLLLLAVLRARAKQG